MRERMKKPLTARGVELAFARLEELADGEVSAKAAIVEQSIFHGWQGFFPLREKDYSPGGQ